MEYSLEFDGSTVLCRVCGDKASGFHYGVHTCEGCKGFFRRSIQQKIQYKPCTKNQQCSVLRVNRNRCQYCRLKKCISVGMSRDAVRFGRVPKREKAKILAAMQKNNQSSQEKMLNDQLLDEQSMLNAIFEAHTETCDFTNLKMASIFHKAEQNPIFADYPSQMTCPLNPLSAPSSPDSTQINDSFSPAIRGVVEFARRLPGFSSLPSEDQVTLLKAGVFEALLVRLAVLFRTSDKMYCLNGQILRRSDAVDSSQNGRFLFECMFEFGERVNALGLVDKDIALFSAVVLVTPDRPGLRNVELVQKIHQKLDQLLMNQVAGNHPDKPNLYSELKKKIPDLRTLNTLHSEKLLAIKMDSHNSATDGVVSTSSSSNASTPNYSYAEYYTNNYKCNQSVVSDWSDFGSPRSIGSSCDNESSKTLDLCPYSPSEQIAQFHLSNNHNSINSSSSNQHQNNSHVTSNNSVSSPGSSNSSCGSSNQLSSAGQISQRASSSLSNFSSSSNHSYSGALALHSSSIASSTASICSASSTNADRSSSVISKPRFGQLNCFFNGSASSSNSNAISVNSHHNLISSHHRNSDEEKISGLNRRVDSPADSGIESGKEGNSATSVCSSPRSDSEDHHQPQVSQTSQGQIQNSNNISTSSNVISSHHNNGSIDDMPMLKRALQAPPLLNTSSLLMDEAYRHHKKFRATKMQQAQRELEAQSPQSSSQTNLSTHDELVQQHQSLASTHSTLVKTLQQQPRFANEQQLKRTDLIHTIIMRGESGLNSKFNVLENNSYSADSSSLISSQMSSTSVTRSSIIHTTSSSQSTLQQLLAPKSQQPSSSIYSNGNLYSTTGSAPSPIKNNQHISNNGSYSAAPLSPASSLVNNHSPPPPVSSAGCGLLSNQPMFHYTPAPSHLYNGSNLDAHMSLPHHHHIHPMYAHHTSTSMLMEAQPLNLSKKSSAPITPPISPSNIKLES